MANYIEESEAERIYPLLSVSVCVECATPISRSQRNWYGAGGARRCVSARAPGQSEREKMERRGENRCSRLSFAPFCSVVSVCARTVCE